MRQPVDPRRCLCRYRQASNRDPPILYRHKSPSSVPGRPDRARSLNLPMPEASYRFRQQITIGLEIRDSSSTRTRSGAASSCRNTDRAASSSICALSSSPSARQASPISTWERAASYGASSSPQPAHARRTRGERGPGVALGQQDRPGRMRRQGRQKWRTPHGRDPGQLLGSAACCGDVAAAESNLDVGAQHPGPRHDVVLSLDEDPAHRGVGLIDPTLSKPQLRQTRLWLASPLVRLPVRHLCLSELTPQTVQLGPHVVSGAEGRLARRSGEPVACALHLRHSIRARTSEQH